MEQNEQTVEQKARRQRRSKDVVIQEKVQKLRDKIEDYKVKIAEAEKEINDLMNPAASVKMKDIKDRIAERENPWKEDFQGLFYGFAM